LGSGKSSVLVVGSGGREHALVWKLGQSNLVDRLYIAPGNGGTEQFDVNIKPNEFSALAEFAKSHDCVTIVGPETPLAEGIVDRFAEAGLPIFGPTQKQAQLEWSKSYAKEFMTDYGIPTAAFHSFTDSKDAIDYARSFDGYVAVKADGLAAGKGVVICDSNEEAEKAIRSMIDEKAFGESGRVVVVEERLEGREISLMTIADGEEAIPFGTAVDYKRLWDEDEGPNTGGMGAYSPSAEFSELDIDFVMKQVVEPTVEHSGFFGFLYVGLMLTKDGPKVLEFNCRLGDPETQVILPRLESDLFQLISSLVWEKATGLRETSLMWNRNSCCTVAMCSEGYPAKPRFGDLITGIEEASQMKDALIFHSGTVKKGNKYFTSGGRVLFVTGIGSDLEASIHRAYSAVGLVSWKGEHHRHDIGVQNLSH
jgi:phosphoribosylamine---glycine ligase